MNKEDFLKGIYDDFFGIGKIEKENEKLRQDIEKLSREEFKEENYPYIEIPEKTEEKRVSTKEEKDTFMENVFKRIEELYIDDKSKEILKKIIEYIRKYNEKIEKQFISFNMSIFQITKKP